MDDLKKLYYRIENPINDKSKWNKLLNIYSSSLNYDEFYNDVVIKEEKDDSIYYNEKDKETFYLFMWSVWRRKLLNITEDEFQTLIENKVFDTDIYDTINRIIEIPEVKSYIELLDILTSPEINRYFSNFFDDFNHKIIIYSDFNIQKDTSYNTVFTAIVDPEKLYKLLVLYINSCTANLIPYYVKYSECGSKILLNIYSTLENSDRNVKILEELNRDNILYFYDNFDLLSGKINSSIAIRGKDYYNTSQYLKERSLIIFKSFDSVIYEYILNHLDIMVSYKDKKLDIIDYLSTYVMEKVVKDLVNKSVKNNKEYFSVANSDDLVNFKKYIKDRLVANMKNILKDRLYLKVNKEKININLNKSKNLNIDVDILMSAIRGLTPVLMSIDNKIEDSLRVRIKNECQFFKVDYDKFCLDYGFAKKVFFNKEKYVDYKKEIERIHTEINRSDVFENLTSYEFGQISNREPIKSSKESMKLEEDN